MDAIRSNAIVHFAGHAVIVGPGLGAVEPALLVAPSDSDRGQLRASNIADARFDRTHLVMLAGCRTAAVPDRSDDKGNRSIALAFIAAGVPTVVATRLDLPDNESESLAIAIHQQVARGEEAGAALGDAMRLRARDNQHRIRLPLAWANLLVIGGSKDFLK
jgi:CHAT domain-containing protein